MHPVTSRCRKRLLAGIWMLLADMPPQSTSQWLALLAISMQRQRKNGRTGIKGSSLLWFLAEMLCSVSLATPLWSRKVVQIFCPLVEPLWCSSPARPGGPSFFVVLSSLFQVCIAMGCSFSRYHQVLASLFRENSRRLGFPCLLWALHPLQPEAETKWFVESFEKLWKRNVGTCIRLVASPPLFLCPSVLEKELRGTVFLVVLGTLLRKISRIFRSPVEEPARLEAFGDLEWKQPRLGSIQWFFLRGLQAPGRFYLQLQTSELFHLPKRGKPERRSPTLVLVRLETFRAFHNNFLQTLCCPNSCGFPILPQDNTHFALQVSWASAAKHLPLLSAWKVCNLACLVLQAVLDFSANSCAPLVEFPFRIHQGGQPLQLFVATFLLFFCIFSLFGSFDPGASPPFFGTLSISDFSQEFFLASCRKCRHLTILGDFWDFTEMEFGKVFPQRAAFCFLPAPGNCACLLEKRRRFGGVWVELGRSFAGGQDCACGGVLGVAMEWPEFHPFVVCGEDIDPKDGTSVESEVACCPHHGIPPSRVVLHIQFGGADVDPRYSSRANVGAPGDKYLALGAVGQNKAAVQTGSKVFPLFAGWLEHEKLYPFW